MLLNFVQIAVYNFKFNKKMKVKINKPINPRKVNSSVPPSISTFKAFKKCVIYRVYSLKNIGK